MANSRKPFILTRTFDAPRQLVWDTFTKAEHLKHGMGPAGTKMDHVKVDLRPGGVFHYGMKMPDGNTMWGKWTFREIDPPKKLVVVVSFSDENLGVTHHPIAPGWPLETLSTTTFAENDGKTTITLEWRAVNATEEERDLFDSQPRQHDGRLDRHDGRARRLSEDAAVKTMKDHSSEHGSFVVERTIDAPPSLVFTAFSTEESKKRWFAAPDAKYLVRAFDFRVGGHDRLKGQWPNGLVSDFRAEYFDIVPDARIVYVYEMYLDDVKISVSLATVEFKPQGKGTRLIYHRAGRVRGWLQGQRFARTRHKRIDGSTRRFLFRKTLKEIIMKTSAYLNFDGNCAEAFQFYAKTFPGKDLHIMKQGDTQKDAKASEKDWVLHAYLKIGDADIMASDTFNHTKPAGMHAR
jgi:uncharacterized protein YndB with AHSA1/START domain